MFLAAAASAALSPTDVLSISKNSCVLPLRALNPDAILSINASSLEFATSNCLFRSVNLLTNLPVPPISPVNNAPSVPNLILFNSSLVGSSSVDLSIFVGPPIKSPNDPIFSTSPTNTASAKPPPNAPAINLFVLPRAFNSNASSTAPLRLGFVALKYLLFLPARIASSAILDAILKPLAAGKPILTNASVILPAVVASAFSSNSVRSSKKDSTLAALP